MKGYVQRLVALLCDSEVRLSRNRHFSTFDNPDGRRALRISRELRSLARDIVAQAEAGNPVRIERVEENGALVRVLVDIAQLKARRTAFLSPEEFEILLSDENVREALERAKAA
ncbi:MAG TPA: hypothetical protein DFS52_11920 [Myxococcales bacterium]|jgi:hypothetical protein|nr:hypothetical protein [Myxococcales bacterium]